MERVGDCLEQREQRIQRRRRKAQVADAACQAELEVIRCIGLHSAPSSSCLCDILANANKARVIGLEFEGLIIPVEPLTISGTYSYNDAKFLDYITIPIPAIPSALTAAQPSRNLSSTPFTYVARHKFSLDGRLALPIPAAEGDMAIRATYSWQSRQRVAPDAQPFDTIASYGLLNLRLEWNQMRGAPLDLAIYGTNVLDKAYRITANTGYNNSGFSNSIYGEPAQYGLSLRYRF